MCHLVSSIFLVGVRVSSAVVEKKYLCTNPTYSLKHDSYPLITLILFCLFVIIYRIIVTLLGLVQVADGGLTII
jgi:hypothetical protein